MESVERRKKHAYRIDPRLRQGFRLDGVEVLPQSGSVIRNGIKKHLHTKAMEVLLFLCQNHNRLVTMDTLLSFGWGDKHANRANLTNVISEIRQALDDHVECPSFIQTIPTRGYRLIAKVTSKGETVIYPDAWSSDVSIDRKTSPGTRPNRLAKPMAIISKSKLLSVSVAFVLPVWFLLQLIDIFFPMFNIPEWVQKVVLLILIVGLPVLLMHTLLKEVKRKHLSFKQKDRASKKRFYKQLTLDMSYIVIITAFVGLFSVYLIESIQEDTQMTTEVASISESIPIKQDLVAVLPFNIMADALPDYFKKTFHLEMLNTLKEQDNFRLVSERMIKELGTNPTLNEILDRTRAFYVLDGNLVQKGDDLYISIQLTEAISGINIWSTDLTGNISKLLIVQNEIYRQIFNAFAYIADQPVSEVSLISTDDFQAYDHYIQGKNILANANLLEQFKAAELHFLAALDLDPNFVQARIWLCQTYINQYSVTNNLNSFNEADIACGALRDFDNLKTTGNIALANLSEIKGNNEEALRLYKDVLEEHPDNLAALRRIANLIQNEDAIPYYRDLITAEPGYWENYYDFGTFYFDKGDYPSAVHQFAKAHEMNTDNPKVMNSLGASYLLSNHPEEAITLFEQSIRIQPGHFAYSNLGTAYYMTGDYERAIPSYIEALNLSPDSEVLWANLGDVYIILNQQADARDAYKNALELVQEHIKINPSDLDLQASRVRYLAEVGDCEAAQNEMSLLLSEELANPYIFYKLSIACIRCDQREDAIRMAQKSINNGLPIEMLKQDALFKDIRDDLSSQNHE